MAGWNGATRSQIVRRKVNGAPVMMEKGGRVSRAALPLSIALLSTYIVSNDKVVLEKKKNSYQANAQQHAQSIECNNSLKLYLQWNPIDMNAWKLHTCHFQIEKNWGFCSYKCFGAAKMHPFPFNYFPRITSIFQF